MLKAGDNYFRVLPPWSEKGSLFKPIRVIRFPKPIFATALDLTSVGADHCPVREAFEYAADHPGSGHPFCAESRSTNADLVNAMVFTMTTGGPGVGGVSGLRHVRTTRHALRLPPSITRQIGLWCLDPAMPPICDESRGRIVKVTRSKTSDGVRYEPSLVGVEHPLADVMEIDDVYERLHDLDALVAPSPAWQQSADWLAERVLRYVRGG